MVFVELIRDSVWLSLRLLSNARRSIRDQVKGYEINELLVLREELIGTWSVFKASFGSIGSEQGMISAYNPRNEGIISET